MESPMPQEQKLHRIVVTGIIWREEAGTRTYLITKRAGNLQAWPGKWHVPGGGMQADDYTGDKPTYASDSPQWYRVLEKAVKREIREETGIEVEDVQFLLDLAFVRHDGIPCLVLSMYCRYSGGEVALNWESSEYAWITAAKVGDYDLIQGIDDEIKLVEERLGKT